MSEYTETCCGDGSKGMRWAANGHCELCLCCGSLSEDREDGFGCACCNPNRVQRSAPPTLDVDIPMAGAVAMLRAIRVRREPKEGDIDAQKKEIEKMAQLLMEILTKRAHNPESKYHNPTFVKKILKDKKPVWIYPAEALEAGIVDEVVE